MNPAIREGRKEFVLGQKLAFATAALLLGIASFVSLLGMEKGILAIAFACLALQGKTEPRLEQHRGWAKTGLVLGTIIIILVLSIMLLFHERVAAVIEVLENF